MSEIKGKIVVINETQVVSDKFQKREFVVETSEQYPQFIPMQFTQDKCDVLDVYRVGQTVTAHINIRGKKYTNKTTGADGYFLSLECWKLSAEPVSSTPEKVDSPVSEDLPF
jgi:hypothetical protein